MSRIRRLAPWLSGFIGILIAGSADAQNIDAGKSPAQIFADTCSACHRNARELKRTSTGFLRSHYTTGQEEAAAMASYLAGVGSDPRAAQQKRQPGAAPAEAAKQPPRQSPTEQAKGPAGQPSSKGTRRPPASAEARPMTPAPEEKPPEPPSTVAPVAAAPAAAAAPKPVLVPFEE